MEDTERIMDIEDQDSYDLISITAKGKTLTKFDIWERKLLDFSLRNTLLNLSPRRRAVQFIAFDLKRIEAHLQDGKEYRIAATPDEETQTGAPRHLLESGMQQHLRERISEDMDQSILHTFLPEDETKTVLKKIQRTAKNTIEEGGVNSLFLAIGTLKWYVSEKSTTPRYAPLLLLPVEMVYKKGSYHIRTRDEEITFNITLIEFLRQNFDIDIPGLDPLPQDENGLDVGGIFAAVCEALKEQPRWKVEEECVLGIFSFSKFLLWNDMRAHRDELTQNQIVGSLLANRLLWTPTPMTTDLSDLDSMINPSETAVPVAADSSQMAAIIEAGAGNSFILYGPPGTGKSQTITNLIANALFHGKRVLFVAEKMAALSVVQSRLEKIGLDPFCLELHSKKSTKRHVLSQLDKALSTKKSDSPTDYASESKRIAEKRKELSSYLLALHTPDAEDGLSVYDCIDRSESIPTAPMEGFIYDKAIDDFMKREGLRGVEEILGSRLRSVVDLAGQPSEHPLRGLKVDRSMLGEAQRMAEEMKQEAKKLSDYGKEAASLSEAKPLRERLLRDNSEDIFSEDPELLRRNWREAKAKWALPRYFATGALLKRLRKYNPFLTKDEIEQLIDDLIRYRGMHDRITAMNELLRQRFAIETAEDEVPDSAVTDEKSAILERWSLNMHRIREWLHWSELSAELKRDGMGCVADIMEREKTDPATVKDAFLKALLRHKGEEKIMRSDTLAAFEGTLFDEKAASYRRLANDYQELTRHELYARLASRVPKWLGSEYTNGSEPSILLRNILNGGRGISIRDLFDQLPTLLPRLCPVMLMSPMSVAQYIDLKADKFDLVIFDEASQLPTSEAVGAIARGKSLIVVGDPKQMPPTSFFSANTVDEEEVAIDDMESILEDCRSLDMPSLQLSWHYRSRHESLIAFSNHEYYDGSLITFPSVDDNDTKVHFIHVEGGYYEKGGSRSNLAEATAIVDEIEKRLKGKIRRKKSIGVIAFSSAQQTLIEDLLQERLEQKPKLMEIASAMPEPIFIKNLENAQGDERDVILFSIGYGPDKDGKVSMNFGPLNNQGGERRLNVAVSRARHEMYVFSTLRAGDIDLRKSKAKGVEGLKHFLQYAETLWLPNREKGIEERKPSAIAKEIAEELELLGYNCTTNVGKSKFRVDVAVEKKGKPGKYSLGILLDGEGYRDTPTANDREVVQPTTMEGLGWNVMRVWSVDWIRDRKRVMERIVGRL